MLVSLLAQGVTDGFMPHGMCYLWQEHLVWLHVVSDAFTTLAYWAIPPFLVYFALKVREEIPPTAPYARRRLPYDWMFMAFGLFIVACGATHAMGIWTIWEPRYWLEGGVKAVTALASVATAIALPPLIPRALELIHEARESEVRRVELEEAHEEQKDLVRRLREADRVKSRLLANVSHDLRTPLSLIEGPVEELLEEDLPAGARERLETVLRNARNLEGRVDDLLSVARMERDGLEVDLRPSDLASSVSGVVARYEDHARRRGIDFRLEIPEVLPVRADPRLLRRAVQNLLSNAFKFTPDGGTVRCTLERAGRGEVRLVVSDSGPGIPDEEREAVFERFRQGRAGREDARGGTGLGLAIVREVALAHGGTVTLDRAAEGGARFELRLPVSAEEAGAQAESRPEASPTSFAPVRHPATERSAGSARGDGEASGEDRATVLVVEDDAEMARYLVGLLEDEYRVAAAADGREGLERAEALEPDLVLTDVMMPEMNGRELLAALRERPRLASVPVLVLTARADEELPERMLRGGAQDYVVKPARREELRARIENLLELTRTRRLLQEALSTDEEGLEELAEAAARRKRELERAVEENRLLMRELHHRVKGNLQTITSLLQLQLRNVDDERARRPLQESRGRVAAMSLLHDKLYRTGVPDRVELSGYLRSLVSEVFRTRGSGPEVEARLTLEEVEVDVDRAVPCGLVVHELVTNALRHAFPGEEGGTVDVELRTDGQQVTLVVADDGRGLEEASERDEHFGLRLVESLAAQLDGEMRVEGSDGTRVEVVFPPRGNGETSSALSDGG